MADMRTRPVPVSRSTSIESPSFTRVTVAGNIGLAASCATAMPANANPAAKPATSLTTELLGRSGWDVGGLLRGGFFEGQVFMRTVYHIRPHLFTVIR